MRRLALLFVAAATGLLAFALNGGDAAAQLPEGQDALAEVRPVNLKLTRPMSAQVRTELEADGYEVLDYLGDSTYVVSPRRGGTVRRTAPTLGSVQSRNRADIASPQILADSSKGPGARHELRVMFWHNAESTEINALLRSVGARDMVVPRDNTGRPRRDVTYFDIETNGAGLTTLLDSPLVRHVGRAGRPRMTNQTAVAVARADLVQSPNLPYDLNGDGAVIGVWDGRAAQASHIDFGGRVIAMDPYLPTSGGSWHATQVIGTILGSGARDVLACGFAPAARAYSYDFFGSITSERRFLHHNHRHTLENHSWNYGVSYGGYDAAAVEFDYDAKDLLLIMVRSAGNDGPGDGTIPSDIGSKNSIVVGAVDDNGLHTANSNFSSRGPMNDGRMGVTITSNGVSVYTTHPENQYITVDGTSFAAPGVTGTLALLEQLWKRDRNNMPLWPDTAMAVLYQTAADRGNPGPDYQYGFGVVDAKAAADLIMADAASGGKHIVRGVARQDEVTEYEVTVSSSATPLKVTLSWLDTPASPNAPVALVNDLDLVLISPSGQSHYPYSGLTGTGNQTHQFTRTGPNRRDNTEQAVVDVPAVGLWRVRVFGHSVPNPASPTGYVLAANLPLSRDQLLLEDALNPPNNGTSVAIPDNDPAGLVYSFNVARSDAIQHVRLYVNIVHAMRGHLDIRLVHPDGTEIRLEVDDVGVGDGNREDLFAVYPETRPGFADVTPLYGKPANGLWTVRISDRQPGQPIGWLHYLALELEFDSTPGNDAPVAIASPGQNVFELDFVQLDGSASYDPEGQPLLFEWVQLSGPTVMLNGANTATPSFTAPLVAAPTDLEFRLKVTDVALSFDIAHVVIHVDKAPNNAPVADAGPNQQVVEGSPLSLNGSSSFDADGHTLTFLWTQLSGPTASLTGADTATASFSAPYVAADSVLVFRLQVWDVFMALGEDTVSIIVLDGPNAPPVAAAGNAKGAVHGSLVMLDGTASSDPDAGQTLTFFWQQLTGAVAVTLSDPHSAMPTFVAPNMDTVMVFRLTVTDPNGVSSSATTTVWVNATGTVGQGPKSQGGSSGGGCGASPSGAAITMLLLLASITLLRVARRRTV